MPRSKAEGGSEPCTNSASSSATSSAPTRAVGRRAGARSARATVHEAMGRVGLMKPYMRPIYAGAQVSRHGGDRAAAAGRQLDDARRRRADPSRATSSSRPCTADSTDGFFGDLLATSFQARGARGLVIDGGVRDVQDLTEMGSRSGAARSAPRARSRRRSARSTSRWSAPARWCTPGDVIVADDDGVVVRAARRWRRRRPTPPRRARPTKARSAPSWPRACSGLDMYKMREPLEKAGLQVHRLMTRSRCIGYGDVGRTSSAARCSRRCRRRAARRRIRAEARAHRRAVARAGAARPSVDAARRRRRSCASARASRSSSRSRRARRHRRGAGVRRRARRHDAASSISTCGLSAHRTFKSLPCDRGEGLRAGRRCSTFFVAASASPATRKITRVPDLRRRGRTSAASSTRRRSARQPAAPAARARSRPTSIDSASSPTRCAAA